MKNKNICYSEGQQHMAETIHSHTSGVLYIEAASRTGVTFVLKDIVQENRDNVVVICKNIQYGLELCGDLPVKQYLYNDSIVVAGNDKNPTLLVIDQIGDIPRELLCMFRECPCAVFTCTKKADNIQKEQNWRCIEVSKINNEPYH